jgi:hypothetical protein
MRYRRGYWAGLLAVLLCACVTTGGNSGIQEVLRDITSSQGPTLGEIAAGLKEALHVGTSNVVQVTSRTDGFYRNPQIRIPLPEKVAKAEKLLRTAGFGPNVDAFELSMNRAAEKAAPEARALFVQTISQMTFSDARKILNGRENEATLYFKDKTYAQLAQRFKPLVHSAMSEVGVTGAYQRLTAAFSALQMGESLDLDQYVTGKALDGLFVMLAREEAKIRQDPAARVTDLLRKVFSEPGRASRRPRIAACMPSGLRIDLYQEHTRKSV